MNRFLYLFVILVWGSTWIAIKNQLGEVPVENSIFYRFALASSILFVYLIFRRKLYALEPIDHAFCLLQGLFLFCLNFFALYHATKYIESGLVCVIFSLSTVFNSIINWLIYRNFPDKKTTIGSVIGLIGISLIFWKDIVFFDSVGERLFGIALATIGTFSFSCGNIITLRHKARELPISTTNAWGMLYGATLMLLLNIVFIGEFKFSTEVNYVVSLLFLAIPGSVLVFAAYLGLISRLGPSRAAYATILFPIVALTISFFYEHYRPDVFSLLGIAMALAGNTIVFYNPNHKPQYSVKN